jgi:hypothetical protein
MRRHQRAGERNRITVPMNAYLVDSPYGRGWECDRGYRLGSPNLCVAVPVPLNGVLAALAMSGNAIEASGSRPTHACRWRFQRTLIWTKQVTDGNVNVDSQMGSGCAALAVPANAYVDYSGDGWNCIDGFVRRDRTCTVE